MNQTTNWRQPKETRKRLVAAAQELCWSGASARPGWTRFANAPGDEGAFFHHFKSKDEIGSAALGAWAEFGMAAYAEARKPREAPARACTASSTS